MTTKPEAKPTDEKRISLQVTKDGQRADYAEFEAAVLKSKKHPIQIALEIEGIAFVPYKYDNCGERGVGLGVHIQGAHKIGGLVLDMVQYISSDDHAQSDGVKKFNSRLTNAIRQMGVDVYPYPHGAVAWFPVAIVEE